MNKCRWHLGDVITSVGMRLVPGSSCLQQRPPPDLGTASLGGEASASSQPAVLGRRDPSGSQLVAGSFLTLTTRGRLPPLWVSSWVRLLGKRRRGGIGSSAVGLAQLGLTLMVCHRAGRWGSSRGESGFWGWSPSPSDESASGNPNSPPHCDGEHGVRTPAWGERQWCQCGTALSRRGFNYNPKRRVMQMKLLLKISL